MAYPTSVNNQVTDSVTQANVQVVAIAPSIAVGNLYQASNQALGNAAHNCTFAQQQSNILAQAVTTVGVANLYSTDSATTGKSTKKMLG